MTTRVNSEPVYTFINNNHDLRAFCESIKDSKLVAIDTEFVGEKYYYPKLEVIQIGASDKIAIVDCQEVSDYTPLKEILQNEQMLKLFHAGKIDWELLLREVGALPIPVFDTQIAAAFLGRGPQISHSNLVRQIVGAELSAKQTTSDWSARPLTDQQLAYAALDVHYLPDLYNHLNAELQSKDRGAWFLDEQQRRLDEVTTDEEDDSELYRRVKDWASLSGRELAALQELALWREKEARRRNTPRKFVMTDDGLVELARFQPTSKDKALKLRRVNGGQVAKNFDEIARCLDRARKLPKDQWPRKPMAEKIEIAPGVLEICQALLRSEADRSDVAATIIATTSDITRLITHPEDEENPLLQGWRRELAGQRLLDLISGRLAVRIAKDGNLELVKVGNGE